MVPDSCVLLLVFLYWHQRRRSNYAQTPRFLQPSFSRKKNTKPTKPIARLLSKYRCTQPLIKQNLVEIQSTSDKRAKEVFLTQKGKEKIVEALPHWQQAQQNFLNQFGHTNWASLFPLLQEVVSSAQSIID